MRRKSNNESTPEMVMEILEWIFQILPPWTSIPIGLIGLVAVAALWFSVIKILQLQIVGIVLGLGFAFLCFIAGIKGVQFRRRQMAFLKADIDLKWVQSLTWQGFEKQLASVYRQNGYQVEETGGGGPDGGIDLKLFKDGRTTVVQCKHWKTWKVTVKPIRELYGVMHAEQVDAAIFITSHEYTADALRFAEGKPMTLIDQHGFLDLVRQFQKDLRQQYGEPALPQAPVTFQEPACPLCQSPMKLRTARKGQNAGNQFWGCSQFPTCHGTRTYQA